MRGLIYLGYAIAIIGVICMIADALKGLFEAWRDSAPPTVRRIVKKVPYRRRSKP